MKENIEAKETDRVLRNRWLLGANKQLELARRIPPTLVRLLLGPPSGNERVDVGALDKRLDNPNDVPGVLLVDLSNNRLVGMQEDAAAAAEEKDDIVVVSLARSDCCCSSLLSFGVEVDGWLFLSAHPLWWLDLASFSGARRVSFGFGPSCRLFWHVFSNRVRVVGGVEWRRVDQSIGRVPCEGVGRGIVGFLVPIQPTND